jgi:hypothetical protein
MLLSSECERCNTLESDIASECQKSKQGSPAPGNGVAAAVPPGDRRRRRLGRDDLVGTGRGKSRGYTPLAVFLLPEIALYIARKRALWTHSV